MTALDLAAVLAEHRDSDVTAVYKRDGDDERIVGGRAYCYCGGVGEGLEWMTRGPVWRSDVLPGDGAERALRAHVAAMLNAAVAEWLRSEAVRSRVAEELVAAGGGVGGSIHSWRCEHRDRYGECDCVNESAGDIAAALAAAALSAPDGRMTP